MTVYLGDFPEDSTVHHIWSSYDADGGSVTRATDGTISVYKDNGTTQSTAGVTDTEDFDGVTGIHAITIDTSADAFYATGSNYSVVLSGATIDGETVNAVLCHFSIENRTTFPKADYPTNFSALGIESDGDLTKVNTLDGHTAQTADVASGVDVVSISGDSTAADNLEAALDGTGGVTISADLDGSVGSVTGAINTSAGTITTLDGLDTAQDSQHSTTQSAISTAQTDLDIITGSDGVTLATSQGNYAPNTTTPLDAAGVRSAIGMASADLDTQLDALPTAAENRAEMDSNSTQLAAIVADTNELQSDDIPGTLATIAGYLDTEIAAILEDTGTTIPGILGSPSDFGSGTSTLAANLQDLADNGTASYDRSTDSLQAIRDRGDAAWTTGAGGTPPQLLQNTTIASLASQTSFTLDAGSEDDDAYNGAVVVVTDQSTSTQKAVGSVSDYVGSSKTITLSSDPGIFTMATGDTVDIIANASTAPSAAAVRAEIDSNSTQLAAIVADTNELQTDWANGGRLDLILDARASQTTADAIEADTQDLQTQIGTDGAGLTNMPWNSTWDAEVQSEVTDALNAYDPPTKTELDSGFSGLNDLDAAGIRSAVGMASADLDTQLDAKATAAALSAAQTDLDTITDDGVVLADSSGHGGSSTVITADHIVISSSTDHGIDVQTTGSGKHAANLAANNSTGIGLLSFGELHGAVMANTSGSTGNGLRIVSNGSASALYASAGGTGGDGLELASSNGDVVHSDTLDAITTDVLTTQMTESYAANGTAPTLAQAQFAIHQMLMQFGISGTSLTVRQLNDSTTAFVVTLDDATSPTDASRT